MAEFNFKDKKIYYEIHGEGKPFIILNGIMMSTLSWQAFLENLSANNQVILLDFLDQGQSDKMQENYTQALQVEMLSEFISFLGLEKVSLVGISYGGAVAVRMMADYSNQIDRVVLLNTSHRTSPWLKDIGDAWNINSDNPLGYYLTTIPTIYSPAFYEEHHDWMKERQELLVNHVFNRRDFIEAMIRLTRSAENFDYEEKLRGCEIPTLIVSSDQDMLTPLEEQKTLQSLLPYSDHVIISDAGHASMYEKPLLFVTLVLGFINATNLSIKIT